MLNGVAMLALDMLHYFAGLEPGFVLEICQNGIHLYACDVFGP